VAAEAPDEALSTNTIGAHLSSSRFWTTTWTPALDAACNSRLADGSPTLTRLGSPSGHVCTTSATRTPRG